ncbi:hypothetical protein B0H14DRAFT_1080058 [Mycena olivaceomarginata]|nr:hypothetical protein B0H14DRAFT_1080058 [Mycena olivaceomarginata]
MSASTRPEVPNSFSDAETTELSRAGIADAPLWFQIWHLQSFVPLRRSLDTSRFSKKLDVEEEARRANSERGTGHNDPFEMVPFKDGTDPITAPHALPALHNTSDIRGLTPAESTLYCQNYGLEHLNTETERHVLIARHIGYYGAIW